MQRPYQLEESLGYVMVCLCKVGWLLVTISSDFYGTRLFMICKYGNIVHNPQEE